MNDSHRTRTCNLLVKFGLEMRLPCVTGGVILAPAFAREQKAGYEADDQGSDTRRSHCYGERLSGVYGLTLDRGSDHWTWRQKGGTTLGGVLSKWWCHWCGATDGDTGRATDRRTDVQRVERQVEGHLLDGWAGCGWWMESQIDEWMNALYWWRNWWTNSAFAAKNIARKILWGKDNG